MKKKRKHRFRVLCKSRVTNWWSFVVWKDYELALEFKRRMEQHGYHCVLSVL